MMEYHPSSPPGGLTLRSCLAIVRLAARIVPDRDRTSWSEEWSAELIAYSMEPRKRARWVSRLVLFRRATLSLLDAVSLRRAVRHEQSRGPVVTHTGKPHMVSDLIEDIRYGVRGLLRAKGFAIVALSTIALGVGATTTVFSIVDSIVWRPMPYPESDRVVAVWPGRSFSPQEVVRLEATLTTLSAIAAYADGGAAYVREGGAQYLFGPTTSAAFFDVLGEPAYLGRTFRRGEDQFGTNDLTVLSYDFWLREFGADSSIVGRRIILDRQPVTVIGVMPQGFDFLQPETAFARPLTMGPESPNFTGNWVNVVGRLAPGFTIDQAREEVRTVFAGWRTQYGYRETFTQGADVVPLQAAVTETVRSSMLLLMGAVALTLLVATSNLANLLLGRVMSRHREIAVRGAMGAGPWRIVRQLLTESTIVTAIGGAFGVACSVWGVRAVVGILPDTTPRLAYVSIDGRVLLFSVLLVLVTGCASGLVPAVQMRRPHLTALHSGDRSTSGRGRGATRSALVIIELTLSVVLLVGAGVLLKSFRAINEVDTGMQPERLLTFGLSPTPDINAGGTALNLFYDRVIDAVESVPGVQSAAAIHVLPIGGGGWNSSVAVEGRETPDDAPYVGVWWRPVTDGYLQTAGMRLVAGRGLSLTDTENSPWVAVINRAMARRFWGDEDPIGRRFRYNMEGGQRPITVVGVVQDVKNLGVANETPPTVYRPFRQTAARLSGMGITARWIVVRTAADPERLADQIRRTVAAAVPSTPIVNLRPMEAVIRRSLADPRALTVLLTLFSGVALVLGAIGLYGVVAYTVSQRTREIGIRLALGAQRRDVLRSVMRQGLRYAALGLPLGLLGAWAGSRSIAHVLFHVSPTDPATYAAVAGVLVVVVVCATAAPAVRAGRTDPMETLRTE